MLLSVIQSLRGDKLLSLLSCHSRLLTLPRFLSRRRDGGLHLLKLWRYVGGRVWLALTSHQSASCNLLVHRSSHLIAKIDLNLSGSACLFTGYRRFLPLRGSCSATLPTYCTLRRCAINYIHQILVFLCPVDMGLARLLHLCLLRWLLLDCRWLLEGHRAVIGIGSWPSSNRDMLLLLLLLLDRLLETVRLLDKVMMSCIALSFHAHLASLLFLFDWSIRVSVRVRGFVICVCM